MHACRLLFVSIVYLLACPATGRIRDQGSETRKVEKLVLDMAKLGFDGPQILSSLKRKGYTSERLAIVFDGHEVENEELLIALHPLYAEPSPEELAAFEMSTEYGDPLFANPKKTREKKKKTMSGEEIDKFVETLVVEAEENFESTFGGRRMNNVCHAVQDLDTIIRVWESVISSLNIVQWGNAMASADYGQKQKDIAEAWLHTPHVQYLSMMARCLDVTMIWSMAFDATILFANIELGVELILGERGQVAAAVTEGVGFTFGLGGVGYSNGVAFSFNGDTGGWKTIAADFSDPPVCVSAGYAPFLAGGGITLSLDFDAFMNGVGDLIKNGVEEEFSQKALDKVGPTTGDAAVDYLNTMRVVVANTPGLLNFGVYTTLGIDALDIIAAKLVLPDFTVHACTEKLTFCEGIGCEKKMQVNFWKDGTVCMDGVTCDNCLNKSSMWWGKGFTACGSEPPWGDGTYCLEGTSCGACKNKATWWWGKEVIGYYCGTEPPWNDGTYCLEGTSCGACKNKATWWYGKHPNGFYCGRENWQDGTYCLEGTSCNACTNQATWWYGKQPNGFYCGRENWSDGTYCFEGTSCDACRNSATWWYGKQPNGFYCGNEPGWNDGTYCLMHTSCDACKNGATWWYGKTPIGYYCGSEPTWKDGTYCLMHTSCDACGNPATWWVGKAGYHCGKEPCWKKGTVCGTGTTCGKCCLGAKCPWYQFGVCNCK